MTALITHPPALLAGVLWTLAGLVISLVVVGIVFVLVRITRGPGDRDESADSPNDPAPPDDNGQ